MAFEITERKANGMIRYKRRCDCGWKESSTAKIVKKKKKKYTCPKCGKKNSGTVA